MHSPCRAGANSVSGCHCSIGGGIRANGWRSGRLTGYDDMTTNQEDLPNRRYSWFVRLERAGLKVAAQRANASGLRLSLADGSTSVGASTALGWRSPGDESTGLRSYAP